MEAWRFKDEAPATTTQKGTMPMKRFTFVAATLLLALLGWCPPSQGSVDYEVPEPQVVSGDISKSDPLVAASLKAAAEYFGAVSAPCPDGPAVYIAGTFPLELNGAGEVGNGATGGCKMWLNRLIYPNTPQAWKRDGNGRQRQAATVCRTIVHEYGHNIGLDHDSAPGSPLNPNIPPETVQIAGCPDLPAGISDLGTGTTVIDLELRPTCSRRRGALCAKRGRRTTASRPSLLIGR